MAISASPLPNQPNWFSRTFLGQAPQTIQSDIFRPNQMQGQDEFLRMALEQLQNPQAGFAPIAQQAREQFEQQTVPSIAERFSALGSGAQGSSAFGQQLGAAGAGLESDLASQQAKFGQKQQGLAQQLAGLGMQPSFETKIQPGSEGLIEKGIGAYLGADNKKDTNEKMLGMLSQVFGGPKK